MTLRNDILACTRCDLHTTCRSPVPGSGPQPCSILVFGEAPGEQEDIRGEVFKGQAGRELNRYLRIAGLDRSEVRVDNIVRCRPPDNADPKLHQIAACSKWLKLEITETAPELIITVGAFAARKLLGADFSLEACHGIPQIRKGLEPVVIPCYHPALGIHSPDSCAAITDDFRQVGRYLRAEIGVLRRPDLLEGLEDYREAKTPGEARFALGSARQVAVDTEVEGFEEGVSKGEPWCLSFSAVPGTAWVVSAESTEALVVADEFLRTKPVETILHNAAFDLPVLERMGVRPPIGRVRCSMIASALLQSEPLGLKPLAKRAAGMEMKRYGDIVRAESALAAVEYLKRACAIDWGPAKSVIVWEDGKPRMKQPWALNKLLERKLKSFSEDHRYDLWKNWHAMEEVERAPVEARLGPMPRAYLSSVDRDLALSYAARDADATLRVWPYLKRKLLEMELWDVFILEMRCMEFVIDMEEGGIELDVEHLKKQNVLFAREMDKLNGRLDEINRGKRINPGSSPQIARLLFKDLRIRAPKLKGKVSTDAKVLKPIRTKHEAVGLVIDWRELEKLKDTYGEKLPKKIGTDKRIHPRMRLIGAPTGRMSMSNPNAMALPTRSELGKEIKRAFVARQGCKIVASDFGQMDMRIMAHASGDEEMSRIFREGIDIHTRTACRIFDITEDRVEKIKHRYPIKRVGFGTAYGISAGALQTQLAVEGLEWSVPTCQDFIDEWFSLYSGVKKYFNAMIAHARRKGYVRDCFGRIRLLGGVRSTVGRVQADQERKCGASVIQSGTAWAIKQAMRGMTARKGFFKLRAQPLLQVHDQLAFEVDKRIAQQFAGVLREVMVNAVELRVPVTADVEIGDNLADLKEPE